MFPINASITSSVILSDSFISMWTVSGDKNYWSEGVDWIFAGKATPSTNQYISLICTSLLKPGCSQMNCSDQSPDAAIIPTNPHHIKSKRTAHPLPISWNKTKYFSILNLLRTASICKGLPVEGNYDKLEGYAVKNCTDFQDELPAQQ